MSKLIIVDWGTSNFRASLFDNNLNEIDNISSNNGILNVKNKKFHEFLFDILSSWFKDNQNPTILMSGMIGSINGWIETDYVLCDASIEEICENVKKIPNIKENIFIVPGVKFNKNEHIDLMRGEEVQIFGTMKLLNKKDAFIILPGSHSKWVKIKDGLIKDFRTNMTGEVFKVISEYTILEKSITKRIINEEVFKKGVFYSKKDGGLLSHIFQARAQANILKEENIYSFLSGIIIGHEIKEMKNLYKSKEVNIVASDLLNLLYTLALDEYNINSNIINSKEVTNSAMKNIYKNLNKKEK